MIFGAMSDLHFTDKTPENRKEGYSKEQFKKFERALKIVNKTDSKLLLVGGDIFEVATAPYSLVYRLMKLLNKYKEIQICVVPGQHDLRYHVTGLKNTPLGILIKAGYATLLSNLAPTEYYLKGCEKPLTIIGAGWNEEPEAHADVVVTHRMVCYKKPLWPGQKDFSTAKALLKKWSWAKCIISGDNHLLHVADFADKGLQINCGSLMRSTKSQVDHRPSVWLIDSEDWSYKRKKLKVLPSEEAFDFAKIEKAEEAEKAKEQASQDMDEFINSLSVKDSERPKYKEVLKKVIEKRNPNKNVRDIINLVMEEAEK